jgi:mono/diheme cytochrome c family protein
MCDSILAWLPRRSGDSRWRQSFRQRGVFAARAVLVWVALNHEGPVAKAQPISFNDQVQPILSENCYKCHGPDSSTRKPKKHPLRLDREQFAFELRDTGKPVIIKGNPAGSELVRRLRATDDDIMPPASEHKVLTREQIELVERWIAQGAKYEKHWSWLPPHKSEPPATNTGWARQPLDHFVEHKLAENGLRPNPEEAGARLLRRLTFDLTGLPPTPGEVQAFLQAPQRDLAYEQVVDHLLASDACAEHFARLWLDAVRYADTQGLHHDHARSIWPYRDWVVDAFKANLPFDQFTILQMAGDLLPNATLEQKIASGYNRLLPTTGEGGAIPEEYLAIYAKDRVDTTAAVWLGMTTGCATCHDHKFDAISMKDFYALTAFFRNNNIPALDNSTDGNTPPLLFVPTPADRRRWERLEPTIAKLTGALQARRDSARPEFESWLAQNKDRLFEAAPDVAPSFRLPLDETNGSYQGTTRLGSVNWPTAKRTHPGPFGPAPLVDGEHGLEKGAPSLARTGQASYGALVYIEGKPSGAILSRMDKAEAYRGWDLLLTEGRPTMHVIDQWPEKAAKITAKKALSEGRWHHLLAVFDGRSATGGSLALYVDGIAADVEVNNNTLGPNLETRAPLRLGGRSEGAATTDTISNGSVFLQDVRFYDQALAPAQVARLALAGLLREGLGQGPARDTNALYDLYLQAFDEPARKLQAEVVPLRREEQLIRERGATTLIMSEKRDAEPVAWILNRGNYASKGAQVTAAVPESLPPMPPDSPRNRLGLARWLVSRDNPLTARVTVNRLWAQLFGLGIVETTEDFGVMGARPTNQPLLDWLAVDFMDSGWDFRRLVKELVLSATYRQSEKVTPDKLEKDPLNRLISRAPHIRLDAEEIRDLALAASGLLVRKVGGPPVKPYQPDGVWEAVAMKDSNTRVYRQDTGEALYRRSLYTFWKRIAPPPSMEILNAPSREVFCTRRERTDTPLQAFVTMNDPQFVESARQLATVALHAGSTFEERLEAITEPLLSRTLAPEERATVAGYETHALEHYQQDPDAARALLAVGESKADPTVSQPELAAWTLVASQLMNLDESLTK